MFGLEFIVGGLFRLFQEVIKLWKQNKESQHEKDMFELNIKADEARGKMEMQKVELQGQITMSQEELKAIAATAAAQARPLQKTGIGWLDWMLVVSEAASSFVRPWLTYWFCTIMYGAYKAAGYSLIRTQGAKWDAALVQLWTPTDYSIMLSIIGFWFVDRAIRKGDPKQMFPA